MKTSNKALQRLKNGNIQCALCSTLIQNKGNGKSRQKFCSAKCRYKFWEKEHRPTSCPYCGKEF